MKINRFKFLINIIILSYLFKELKKIFFLFIKKNIIFNVHKRTSEFKKFAENINYSNFKNYIYIEFRSIKILGIDFNKKHFRLVK